MAGPDEPTDDLDGTIAWRELRDEAIVHLTAVGVSAPDLEARWLVEEASGYVGAEYFTGLDALCTVRGVAHYDAMLGRRLKGEPIQYVLGHWQFRSLDLMVDRRVLIPRPETEVLVDVVLSEISRQERGDEPVQVVDMGTGTGAIGLSVVTEHNAAQVVLTDVSPEALAVTRANLAGVGRAATRVTVAQGNWFSAIPERLRGELHVIASNPPYVSPQEELPAEVADWEPSMALLADDEGLADIAAVLNAALDWLRPGGAVVLEMAPHQLERATRLATEAGLVDTATHTDLAGRDRILVARRPESHLSIVAPASAPNLVLADDHGLQQAVRVLDAGGVIVIPTDTVYGLACRIDDAAAIERIRVLKARPAAMAIAVLVADTEQASKIGDMTGAARAVVDEFWPGPLTVVLPTDRPMSALGIDGTIGVRCPEDRFVRDVARHTGPLATTSANCHGEPTPTNAQSAAAGLLGVVDLVVDGGVRSGQPSTVAAVSPTVVVFRSGPISAEQIEQHAKNAPE